MTHHLVVMAAGTGGHVIPGLAVATKCCARGWTVSWLGTTQGMENRLVPPTGIALDTIGFTGLRGKGLRAYAHRRHAHARRLLALPGASCAERRPTRCSAWAATCASPAA